MLHRTTVLFCFLTVWACTGVPGPSSNPSTGVRDAGVTDAGGAGVADAAEVPPDAGAAADAAGAPDAAGPRDASVSDAAVATAEDGSVGDASVVPAPDGGADAGGADAAWRSVLYPEGWSWGLSDAEGRALQDWSYAGFEGGAPPPVVAGPQVDVRSHGADPTGQQDSTAALQAALDEAALLMGAVVWVPEGTYRVDGALTVSSSRVVLRGEGPERTRLRFTRVGPSQSAHITVGAPPTHGAEALLQHDGAVGSAVLTVASAQGIHVGDDVAVGQVVTPAFVADHGMTGVWTVFLDSWQPFFRRTVVAVDATAEPPTITVDVALRSVLRVRDGASVRVEHGVLDHVGVEDLALGNAVDRNAAWSVDQVSVLALWGVADAWVRNVRSVATQGTDHLQSGGILVGHSKRVTVQSVVLERAQNRGSGGNGYLFEIRQSSEVLTVDSVGRAGRHNFIQNWGFGTTGCVWLRCVSEGGRNVLGVWDPVGLPAPSEFHHSLATANLVDSCTLNDGWAAGNRGTESSGAGHSASENAFWNVRGSGTLRSLQWGHGYVVGPAPSLTVVTQPGYQSVGLGGAGTAPEDWVERGGDPASLVPASLYEAQRARRLR